jgi:hypothetical protein
MFLFFSISAGKRPVYLLPLYPASSLLLAVWFQHQISAHAARIFVYRSIAVVAAFMGLGLLIITLGGLWNHDPEWFFTPVEALLKAKDRANLLVVKDALATFGWSFTVVALLSALLWFSTAHCLWLSRLKPAAQRLVWISILVTFVTRTAVMPAIAEAKSYRGFMEEVNQRVRLGDKLYLYGESFNSDPVVFYRGEPIATLEQPLAAMAAKAGSSQIYVIMAEKDWAEIQRRNQRLPAPLLTSKGTGPEGDARLVLVGS